MTERVIVTRSRLPAPRRPSTEQASASQVKALMRAQARLAFVTCAVVFVILLGLPLLFALAPGLSHIRLFGVRLPWLILCGGVPPVWVVAAGRHVRRAELVESTFA